MAGRSFEITNAREFYEKLLEDYAAFRQDPISSRLAINCAMTAWHLSEWLYWEYRATLITTYPTDTSYLRDLRLTQCPDLEILRSITNGSKHYTPPGPEQRVQNTGIHEGVFSKQFSIQHDVTHLTVTLDDGSEDAFEVVLERVMAFWQTYVVAQFGWVL